MFLLTWLVCFVVFNLVLDPFAVAMLEPIERRREEIECERIDVSRREGKATEAVNLLKK